MLNITRLKIFSEKTRSKQLTNMDLRIVVTEFKLNQLSSAVKTSQDFMKALGKVVSASI